jgi:hypothetical protein
MLPVISITEMILTLAIAWGLDMWIHILKRQALVSLDFTPYVWGIAAANLFMAGMWVYLAWVLLKRMHGSRWVSMAYFICGLLVTISVALQLTVPEMWRGWLLFDQTRMYRLMVMGVVGLTSRFTLTAAFICVLGAAGLLVARQGK